MNKLRKILFVYDLAKKIYKHIKGEEKITSRYIPAILDNAVELYRKDIQMKSSKFLSRKFIVAITSFVLIVIGAFVSPETLLQVEKIIMGGQAIILVYLLSQGIVDSKKAEDH